MMQVMLTVCIFTEPPAASPKGGQPHRGQSFAPPDQGGNLTQPRGQSLPTPLTFDACHLHSADDAGNAGDAWGC